jgi:hypothetical protein
MRNEPGTTRSERSEHGAYCGGRYKLAIRCHNTVPYVPTGLAPDTLWTEPRARRWRISFTRKSGKFMELCDHKHQAQCQDGDLSLTTLWPGKRIGYALRGLHQFFQNPLLRNRPECFVFIGSWQFQSFWTNEHFTAKNFSWDHVALVASL